MYVLSKLHMTADILEIITGFFFFALVETVDRLFTEVEVQLVLAF